MKNILFLALLFFITISCGSESSPSNSDEPTVENKLEKPTAPTPSESALSADHLKQYTEQKDAIVSDFEAGTFEAYSVRDGKEMVAESSTYFKDEGKTEPVMTKIIFKTGDFLSVYWLTDEMIWISQDEFNYVFKKDKLILSLNETEAFDISDSEREEISKIIPIAFQALESPSSDES